VIAQHALEHGAQVGGRLEVAALVQIAGLESRPIGYHLAAPERPASEQRDGRGAVVGTLGAVDARGAAELGDDGDDGLAPGLLHLGLDAALQAFAVDMGTAWKDTVVIVVTEFGRTARINGTDGTDHGTATVALLVGGAVKGGRMLADWPGLAEGALYEKRDLKPTKDVRGLFKGVLRDHLGLAEPALAQTVFPGSGAVKPFDGLIG
jgi:uncharacterized protein (DUF1501 family)